MAAEIWKDIPGFEGAYQISSLGGVKSLERECMRSDGFVYRIHEKILRPTVNKGGYNSITLRRDNRNCTWEIQRLVALAFLGPRKADDEEVRHLNGNRLDNSVENLAYGTRSQNQLDLYSYRGYHHRLTPANVKEIRRRLKAGEMGRTLAKEFNVCDSNISSIKNGLTFRWLT